MSIHIKEEIKKVLINNSSGLNIKQICWELKKRFNTSNENVSLMIEELSREGLVKNHSYKYKFNWPNRNFTGTIDINRSGNGYIKCDEFNQEIFVSEKNRLNTLNKDTVSFKLLKPKKNKLEGQVCGVLLRNKTKFWGKITKEGRNFFFISYNKRDGSDFFIPEAELNGAQNKSSVIVELSDWPISAGCPFGRVVKLLNNEIDLNTEISANLELFNIKTLFSQSINKELAEFDDEAIYKKNEGREDFRQITTFTIDPTDAKDFDDAISIVTQKNGNYLIGVHIADVSHYVKPESEIDKEAYLRAFSIYFPGRVIPMLPEKLSNNLCSLKEGVDRFTFSVVLETDKEFNILSNKITKGIINSNKRFSYEGVEKILRDGKGDYFNELHVLNQVAKKQRKARVINGSIEFERSSVSFHVDKSGNPISISKNVPLDSHKLVEEFMLLANKTVATKLRKTRSSIFRVHDLPDLKKLREISKYISNISTESDFPCFEKLKLPKFINKILKIDINNTNQDAINNLILRCMAKAKYSSKNIGHFGLGFSNYTHFTSPIRRYSDLLVHRLLEKLLKGERLVISNIEKKCIHFSNTEKTYTDVERSTVKLFQLSLLKRFIGNNFTGVISSVKKWGIYVELDGGRGEGLVSKDHLIDDHYIFNENLHEYVGIRNRKKYFLGKSVTVKIEKIDLMQKEMDLSFND